MISTTIFDRAGEGLGSFLLHLAGALVLLVVGLLVARLAGRLAARALAAAGIDSLADRWGVHDVLQRASVRRSLSRLVGSALRIALSIVVVFAALSQLGLQFLSQSLNQGVLVLPKLLIATALVLAGVVIAGAVRHRVDRASFQMDLPLPLGRVAQITVIAVFVITAAAQIAISTLALLVHVGIFLAAAATTFGLAFGLGGRDLARALSAGRYVRGAYEVGQTIAVGEVRGTITGIEGATTVLDGGDGSMVRVPNHLLLGEIVTVEQVRSAEGSGPDEQA